MVWYGMLVWYGMVWCYDVSVWNLGSVWYGYDVKKLMIVEFRYLYGMVMVRVSSDYLP